MITSAIKQMNRTDAVQNTQQATCFPLEEIGRLLMGLCALITLTSCVTAPNGFYTYYQDQAGPTITNLPRYSGSTKILTTTEANTINDAKSVMRIGYALIGVSQFQGPPQLQSALMSQAKKVGADVVLYSYQYLGSKQTEAPMQRYQYGARFFRRMPPVIFGVMVLPLPNEIRQQLEKNTGAFVYVVVNDSPAFKANILEGDVILKMNGENVESMTDFVEKYSRLVGQKVDLEIWRDGQFRTNSVQLNNKS
jgi:hypothetical protein